MAKIRKPGVNPFITLDDPQGLQAPPEYWAQVEAEKRAALPHDAAPPVDIAACEAAVRAAFHLPADKDRLAQIAEDTKAAAWAYDTGQAPALQMVPPSVRSLLVVNEELAFPFTTPRPGLWRRFWTWALLGWRWRKS